MEAGRCGRTGRIVLQDVERVDKADCGSATHPTLLVDWTATATLLTSRCALAPGAAWNHQFQVTYAE